MITPSISTLIVRQTDGGAHAVRRAGGERDAVIRCVDRFDADEVRPAIFRQVREARREDGPRVPDDGRLGAFLGDVDLAASVVDGERLCRVDVNLVNVTREAEERLALYLADHVVSLVEIRAAAQTV